MRMIVEWCPDPVLPLTARLITSLINRSEIFPLRPMDPITACHPWNNSDICHTQLQIEPFIMRKKPKESFIPVIINLQIWKIIHRDFFAIYNFCRGYPLKFCYVIRLWASVDEWRSSRSVRCGKDPDISVFINLHNRVIMSVGSCFVQNDCGFWNFSRWMIKPCYLMQKGWIWIICPAITKKSFIDFRNIYRERIMICRICSQTSAVFEFILILKRFIHIPNSPESVIGFIYQLRLAINTFNSLRANRGRNEYHHTGNDDSEFLIHIFRVNPC